MLISTIGKLFSIKFAIIVTAVTNLSPKKCRRMFHNTDNSSSQFFRFGHSDCPLQTRPLPSQTEGAVSVSRRTAHSALLTASRQYESASGRVKVNF